MKTTIKRVERALSQRLYMIERVDGSNYLVQGSSDSCYVVSLDQNNDTNEWSCECPDNEIRGYICKHMIFIMVRVLRLSVNDLARKLDCDDLFALQQLILRHRSNSLHPDTLLQRDRPINTRNENVREEVTRREINSECPICYEEMKNSERIVWCKYSCGNNVHKGCFDRWARTRGRNLTCVWCRAKW